MKTVGWVGASLDEVKSLPSAIRRAIGYQINLLQAGLNPDDFKPMPSVGRGVYEIRVRNDQGQNTGRCFYVTKLGDTIFVLHAFEKKSQRTPKRDLDLGAERYRELKRSLK